MISDNFIQNIVKFSQKIFKVFGWKSSKLQRFFSFWKWTKDEDKNGSSDKNLRSFVATLTQTYLWPALYIKFGANILYTFTLFSEGLQNFPAHFILLIS